MADNHENWDSEPNLDGEQATATKRRVQKPRMYKVMLHNDDYTTMDFVVMVLKSIFLLDDARSVEVMLRVHRQGVAVAGVFSYEVAETKISKASALARHSDFPLKCSMEPAE